MLRSPFALGFLAVLAFAAGSSVLSSGCGDGSDDDATAGDGAVSSGNTGGSAASGPASNSSPASTGAGQVVCPTSPPFDDADAALVAQCTRPVAVAVGNALRRAVSYDGNIWEHEELFPNELADQNENSHRGVAVGHGVIVIVGDGGILVSTDGGATYDQVDDERLHDASVGIFKGAFWVVASTGTYTSADGITWTSWLGDTMLPGDLKGAYSGGAMAVSDTLLVAMNGRDDSVRTFDGATWKEHPLGEGFGQLSSIAYGGGKFAIVGYGCCDEAALAGLRANSDDGIAWTLVTNASPGADDFRFGAVLYDGTRFMATASQYDGRTYFAADGLAWTAQSSSAGIGPVTFFQGTYLGARGAEIDRSTDAATWTMQFQGGGDAGWGFSSIASGRVLKAP